MNSLRSTILISLLLGLIIAATAWPAYVAANFAISWFIGEGSILDVWNQAPKRTIIADFIQGYKSSAVFAAFIGFVAMLDFQLLTRHKLTGYCAGLFVPACCIGLAFMYFPEPGYVLPGFVLTGFVLWILYKMVDIGFRLRRVA